MGVRDVTWLQIMLIETVCCKDVLQRWNLNLINGASEWSFRLSSYMLTFLTVVMDNFTVVGLFYAL